MEAPKQACDADVQLMRIVCLGVRTEIPVYITNQGLRTILEMGHETFNENLELLSTMIGKKLVFDVDESGTRALISGFFSLAPTRKKYIYDVAEFILGLENYLDFRVAFSQVRENPTVIHRM